MPPRDPWPSVFLDVVRAALFLTRLPVAPARFAGNGNLASASWAFPLIGAVVGATGALVYWIAWQAGLRAPPAAALALAATMATTGCLHEDGLADTADAFGGGSDRTHKLEIMRDSRIGAFGACALVMSLLLRWSALETIASPAAAATALVAVHAAARAALPLFMRLVPPARADGLAKGAGCPSWPQVAIAGVVGTVILEIALGPLRGASAALLIVASCWSMAQLALRQIGGQTGDVIGTLEQVNEIVALLAAAAVPGIRL